jgi:rod shape determining protein RodA
MNLLGKIRNIDLSIVGLLLLFMILSTVVIYSGTYNEGPAYHNYYVKNMIFYGLGFVAMIGVALLDYRLLLKAAVYLYLTGIILLVTVYLFGVEKNGARSWFNIPVLGIDFQPAELMKLILIIAVAAYLGRRDGNILGFWRDVVPIGLIVLLPFALVLIQPDLGNAIIYLVILLVMYWIGNIKYWHALVGVGAIVAGVALFFYLFTAYHDQIEQYLKAEGKGHWVARIDTFLDPDSVSDNMKWQITNSIRAIGSGGMGGEGFLNGDSLQKGFIPFPYSDSIFVVIGEEFGFRGAAVLLLLYFLLIYRMVIISMQSTDVRGSFIIVGIIAMFVFQVFENIGMMLGIMPLTGITLPFVSYGGTSLLTNMISIGLVLNIKVHRDEPNPFDHI